MWFLLLVSQVVIAVVVVVVYHVWFGAKKSATLSQPAPVLPVAPVATLPTPPKPAPAVEAPPSPEILAVIAAALAAVLDRPHRVVAIQQPATALAPEGNAWAMEGRVEQFLSHRIR